MVGHAGNWEKGKVYQRRTRDVGELREGTVF